MFNLRLLSACIALSVIVHSAIFLLLGFRVTKDVGEGDFAAPSFQINAVLFQNPETLPVPLEKADPSPRVEELPDPLAVERPASLEQGIAGNVEKAPVLSLSIDDYLPPSRLDRIPRALSEVDTTIGFRGMKGVVGEAEIVLLISSSGDIDDILILGSSLPAFMTEEAVLRFRQVKFEPGMVGRWTVRSRLRIRLVPPSNDELLGNPYSAREKAWR